MSVVETLRLLNGSADEVLRAIGPAIAERAHII